jgi:hypothetical protein
VKDLATIRAENEKLCPTTCSGYPKTPCMMWCALHQVYHTHRGQDVAHGKPLFADDAVDPRSQP